MGETPNEEHSDRVLAYSALLPVATQAVANFWWTCQGGETGEGPEPNEGDQALASDVVLAIVDKLPDLDPLNGITEQDAESLFGELRDLMRHHAVYVEGPIRYPGGKDGMFQIRCACGNFVSQVGATPDAKTMWASARDHQLAKQGRQ